MATTPSSRYAPRPPANARSTGSARDAFIDPSKFGADEMSKLTVRLRKSTHKDIKADALATDATVQEWVQDAIDQKLARSKSSR